MTEGWKKNKNVQTRTAETKQQRKIAIKLKKKIRLFMNCTQKWQKIRSVIKMRLKINNIIEPEIIEFIKRT